MNENIEGEKQKFKKR